MYDIRCNNYFKGRTLRHVVWFGFGRIYTISPRTNPGSIFLSPGYPLNPWFLGNISEVPSAFLNVKYHLLLSHLWNFLDNSDHDHHKHNNPTKQVVAQVTGCRAYLEPAKDADGEHGFRSLAFNDIILSLLVQCLAPLFSVEVKKNMLIVLGREGQDHALKIMQQRNLQHGLGYPAFGAIISAEFSPKEFWRFKEFQCSAHIA